MIIASDLDRTLCYSTRAMEELGRPEKLALRPIEKKDGQWVSFMTETSFILLKEICKYSLFVPITTRTIEQFRRFVIFEKELPLSYAITSNGANILFKGEQMREWSDYIFQRMKAESIGQDELLFKLEREGFQFEGQMKQAENLFFYYILNSLPTVIDKNALSGLANKYGWRISLQGRKLYFIPKAISKGAALEFICNREGMKALAGAGDSILDWDFLKRCQYRFVPKHGELANESETTGLTISKNTGVEAGEEILKQLLDLTPLKI